MTWTYEQSTGRLSHDGEPIETGYAGNGSGLNNPAEQATENVGPLPQGTYDIGPARADGGHMGPFVLPLTPRPENTMFGRSAFFMHGDKIAGPPHTASDGCIIMSRGTRNAVASSGDTTLVVVSG
jgi:hypothetical protein